ncbi:MAG: hypothetical protein Kow0074_03080 [Candidatus Zixiibacteriota bacterium]
MNLACRMHESRCHKSLLSRINQAECSGEYEGFGDDNHPESVNSEGIVSNPLDISMTYCILPLSAD